MALPLESATIDAIVMISVIEHIGMGAYGDPVVEDGDMKAMEEIRRVLRPGGLLILTTNIRATAGARIIHPPDGLERIYDIDRLRHLRRGFEVLEEVLYILRRDNRWVPGDYADLCSSTHWAIACLALKRK
jgi:SAM-dependent methyltransferase